MKSISVKLINLYRLSGISNLGYIFFNSTFGCRFYPTCSHYTEQSIKKYGTMKGLVKSFYRILRCNPFNKGGIDLP